MTSHRHRSSAVPLALLYTALIVYASLYPFDGWRWPPVPLWQFLSLPWPRWWTAADLVFNLIGYLPYGTLVFVALVRSGWGPRGAWLTAGLVGGATSLVMETLQNFLPQRVPSNVDAALNLAGASAGAALGALAHAMGGVQRWQTVRDRWFVPRSAGGLALLVLWPVGLLFPLPLPLAVGQAIPRVRDGLLALLQGTSAQPWADQWLRAPVTPVGLTQAGDFVVVALGLLGPSLVAFAVSMPGWRRAVLSAGALGLGVAATTLSTAMNFAPQHALAWATAEVSNALAVAAVLALALSWLPRRAAAALGLMSLTALVVLVAQAPADPYYAISLQSWEQGRFIRFHGAAQWVGWLWPYAAMVHLFTVVTRRLEPGER